jgi:hypothetical protein
MYPGSKNGDILEFLGGVGEIKGSKNQNSSLTNAGFKEKMGLRAKITVWA